MNTPTPAAGLQHLVNFETSLAPILGLRIPEPHPWITTREQQLRCLRDGIQAKVEKYETDENIVEKATIVLLRCSQDELIKL
jgi:hypothetical protein